MEAPEATVAGTPHPSGIKQLPSTAVRHIKTDFDHLNYYHKNVSDKGI